MEDYSLTFEIDAEASKELLDKIKQDTEDQLNSIQQHFEERWQETINNKIQLDEKTSDERRLDTERIESAINKWKK